MSWHLQLGLGRSFKYFVGSKVSKLQIIKYLSKFRNALIVYERTTNKRVVIFIAAAYSFCMINVRLFAINICVPHPLLNQLATIVTALKHLIK